MADKIYIAKAKGGVGATTVCAGLGFALSDAGERTLIVDGDSLCASALTVCGCANMQVFTLADVKKGMCRAKQAMVQHPRRRNLYIMPTLGCADGEVAAEAVREVEGLFDFVLCDGAAERACGRALVVTEPYPPSVKGADAILGALGDGGMNIAGVIVNKVNGGLIVSGDINSPEEIAAALGRPLAAVLPEDMCLTLGVWRRQCMKYFRLAAARIAGKAAKLPGLEAGYIGAGGYLRRRMRERI